jgi:hypothetical protein
MNEANLDDHLTFMIMRVRLNFLLCRMKDIFDAGNVVETMVVMSIQNI